MSIESRSPQFEREVPPAVEISQTEKNLNELVPILAHGLVRRIEQKGFSGKVRVSSMAGEDWGVAKSPDSTTDIPNIIIYPREVLSGDKKVVNAQLRHEIGNLNYPIEDDLNNLREWCEENDISPILLTSLVEASNEASVNYLEMRNSHSDSPEENFRALYEQEINTAHIADNISEASPYKQAVDLSLLYSLSQTGLIPEEQFEQALGNSHQSVQEAFDKQTQSVLSQAVKMSVPKKKIQLIREYVWPKFAELVALSSTDDLETVKKGGLSGQEDTNVASQAKMEEMKKRLEEMKDQMKKSEQKSKANPKKEQAEKPKKQQTPERERPSQKDISPAEKNEQDEIKKQLEESLNERLEDLQEQINELQKTPQPEKEAELESMEDIAEQADKIQSQAEQSMQESQEQLSPEGFEKLQELMDELKELEDVAKLVSETEMPEDEIEEEDEPMTYNIKEYGINEQELNQEQLELLGKTRDFAKETSKTYRKVMRLLMSAYKKGNPNFTQKMVDKLKERGHDLPQFSIYNPEAGREFLSKEKELGIEGVEDDNLLVNFNLPKPFGRFWYKGGSGSKSQPVREGEIEWGDFYRRSMPVIWSATDRAVASGLYLDRLNSFGQHDYKKYYYLWEALKYELPDHENEQEDSEQTDEDDGQEETEQMSEAMQGMSDAMESMEGEMQDGSESGGESSEGESEEQSHDQFQEGGKSQDRDVESLFSQPNEELLKQLRESESLVGSKFSTKDESGNFVEKDLSESIKDALTDQAESSNQNNDRQLETLENLKRQQQAKMESMYREMSGLDGEALRVYVDYMEDTKDFTRDLTDFFIEKFDLDKDYIYERGQRRGARLQRGYTKNILGTKDGKPVINPRSFERKRPPKKPQFAWSLIIDNSGSCSGEIIEQEKKLAVSLVEVAKKLDIPLEIITFGGPDQFTFLKSFEQDIAGEDLQKMVLLNADQGTPDVITLDAAGESMKRFSDKFQNSYNFVYFMTDGQSGSGSIQEVIKKHKRDMVITGIGLAEASNTISETWGKNAVAVPDVNKLSEAFIRKIEDQIDQTFD